MDQSEEDKRSCMRAVGWEDRFAREQSKKTLEGNGCGSHSP
jgi:hypothetical protein